ncbi:prepilin peptidase [Patescibacteria group bacterium]|nr:prepilin peptidase [Patescibacteria group bacterium]
MAIFYFIVFILGLSVGSFLNSVIYRLKSGDSFLFKRSYCPRCKHALTWQDLIPLLNFIILGGKCRYCHQRISFQYPAVELATGILFVSVFLHTFNSFQIDNTAMTMLLGFYYSAAICFLIIIFVYDLKHFIIPDKIIYPAILASGIWYLASGIFFNLYTKYEILNAVFSGLGAAAFFLAIILISRGKWMGLGDPKLAFFMGFFLGFPNILVALFFAFFIGAIIGIGLIVFKKKALKSEVPFGPFLVTGTLIAFFWGETIISRYLNLFL